VTGRLSEQRVGGCWRCADAPSRACTGRSRGLQSCQAAGAVPYALFDGFMRGMQACEGAVQALRLLICLVLARRNHSQLPFQPVCQAPQVSSLRSQSAW
jgi:hypothetical protein